MEKLQGKTDSESAGEQQEVAQKTKGDASKVAPSPASGPECYEQNVAYLPLDMLGTMLSYVDTPKECQTRCQNTANCAHFSYYKQEKICHISDMWAHQQYGYIGVVSGPSECEWNRKVQSLSWIEKDALPEVEGETFQGVDDKLGSVEEMKQWCAEHTDCVGFARQSSTGRWYPSRVGTGFDPRTAVWAKSWGEHWHWYYIQERTDMVSAEVSRKYQQSAWSQAFIGSRAQSLASRAALVCSMGFILAFGTAIAVSSRVARLRRNPGYLVVGQTPLIE